MEQVALTTQQQALVDRAQAILAEAQEMTIRDDGERDYAVDFRGTSQDLASRLLDRPEAAWLAAHGRTAVRAY